MSTEIGDSKKKSQTNSEQKMNDKRSFYLCMSTKFGSRQKDKHKKKKEKKSSY